jgi:delta 1-pyrroline-5-carboxylate dehydrogenase
MLKGAMNELRMGDRDMTTDVGPVIDELCASASKTTSMPRAPMAV